MSAAKKRVYLDHAAATPLRTEVFSAMEPFFAKPLNLLWVNPSALYREADVVKNALETARKDIAKAVGVRPHEVIFTSGATEANNLAILGVAKKMGEAAQIVTTRIEHPSIYKPVQVLDKKGYNVEYLSLNNEGVVAIQKTQPGPRGLPAQAGSQLITLAHANPDIGSVQDIAALRETIGDDAVLHIDAAQSPGLLPLRKVVAAADMITLSGSKVYGPPGIGALIVKDGTDITPLAYGGGQERGLRAGTPYVAGAVGCAVALQLAVEEQQSEAERLAALRNRLLTRTLDALDDVYITGPGLSTISAAEKYVRLPNHASFAFKDIEGDELVVRLDEHGFACGTGTACASGKEGVSRAVKIIDVPGSYQRGTLRVTLGKETTADDIDRFVGVLKETVEEIRNFNNKK